jgi:4'-phosphopantetheinyl transferase EntD
MMIPLSPAGEQMTGATILLHHARLPDGLDPALQARWLAVLPDALAARVVRMREAPDRAATLLGMALLAHCARVAGLEPPQPRALSFPAQGKPVWPAGPDFSISHSAARAGCALAPTDNRVGLDIEQRGTAAGSGLRLVTSGRDRTLYESSGLTRDDLWTAKEAVLKAAGAGVAQAGEVMLEVDSALLWGVRYSLLRPFVATDCSCTVAATRPAGLSVREVNAASILEALD